MTKYSDETWVMPTETVSQWPIRRPTADHLAAHADEIAMTVNYITDDGFIHVRRAGESIGHYLGPSARWFTRARSGAGGV